MTKNTNKTQLKITTRYGYLLFASLLAGVLIYSVIPIVGSMVGVAENQFNTFVYLVAMVAGVVLPVLFAYIIGNKATRAQDKTVRRYNGVLFGLLASWLAPLFNLLGVNVISATHSWLSAPAMNVLVNAWPIIATVATLLVIAYFYKKQSKGEVLLYTPYLVTLWIAAGVTGFVLPLVSVLFPNTLFAVSLFAALVFVAIVGISYGAVIGKRLTRKERAAHVIVATSVGFISFTIVSQLFPYEEGGFSLTSPSSIAIALISVSVWVSYLVLLRRSVK